MTAKYSIEESLKIPEDLFFLGLKALIQNESGDFLLLYANPAKMKHKASEGYWDLPGGRIKHGETIKQTLQREIIEETGLKNVTIGVQFDEIILNVRIPAGNRDFGLILFIYLAKVKKADQIKISNEHIESLWVSSQKASELLSRHYPPSFIEKIKTL